MAQGRRWADDCCGKPGDKLPDMQETGGGEVSVLPVWATSASSQLLCACEMQRCNANCGFLTSSAAPLVTLTTLECGISRLQHALPS